MNPDSIAAVRAAVRAARRVMRLSWLALGVLVLTAASAEGVQFLAIGIVILAHTGALFYWGGRTSKAIETLSEHVKEIREWKHEEAVPRMSQIEHLRYRLERLEHEQREEEES